MPVGSPSLIHNLGLALRRKVIALLANERQNFALPVFHRCVFDQKEQDILFGTLRNRSLLEAFLVYPPLLILQEALGIDVLIHVVLALNLFDGLIIIGVFEHRRRLAAATLDERRMPVDEVVN